jgi:hypothetical protein
MSLTLNLYTQMEYDGKNMCDFFKFFVNLGSSCAWRVHVHKICSHNPNLSHSYSTPNWPI